MTLKRLGKRFLVAMGLTLLLVLALAWASQSDPDIYTTTAPGSTVIPNIENALKAAQSMNSGATAPSYVVQGTWWYDTAGDLIKWYDGSAWVVMFRVAESSDAAAPIQSATALPVDDTTPSVKGITSAYTANANPTTITTFDDGVAGQRLTLRIADANTTIAAALTASGRIIVGVSGDTLEWLFDGAAWKQVGGSVGMGSRFVVVDPIDAIGDWIASNVTSATDVDVSDDGVRKGACAVVVCISLFSSNADADGDILYVRRNGSSDANHSVTTLAQNGTAGRSKEFTVGLDDNAKFEAWYSGAWTSTTNTAYVVGYWI
jgi:hypothetical protein